jgi:hypothetical protein
VVRCQMQLGAWSAFAGYYQPKVGRFEESAPKALYEIEILTVMKIGHGTM